MGRLVNPSTALFVGLFLFYLSGPVMPVSDSKWTIFETVSLLRRGDIDLNEYAHWHDVLEYHGTVSRDGRTYDFFPPGMPMSETAPFLCYALIPFLAASKEHLFRLSLFCVAASVGAAFHVKSIFSADVIEWNRRPEINEHPERLWHFRDPQPLAGSTGLRTFLKLQPPPPGDAKPE